MEMEIQTSWGKAARHCKESMSWIEDHPARTSTYTPIMCFFWLSTATLGQIISNNHPTTGISEIYI
jgi:hypothetical protein